MPYDKGPRDGRWYLSLMAPNTRGERYPWLDPTSVYINDRAFRDLQDDLCAEIEAADVDIVAGLDAMGFILGAGIATRLDRGFLPIRKAGKLCVDTDSVQVTNYTGRSQNMEMRQPAFAPGTRVLLVDQWIETGGTMRGAIELVRRQQGVVAGIVAIAIEESDVTERFWRDFKCVTAILPGSDWQRQADAQYLESFKSYRPDMAFPTRR